MSYVYPIATWACEVWPYPKNVKDRLHTWYNRKMRSVCRVTLWDRHRMADVRSWLGARDIHETMRDRRLRYQGHVARYPDDRYVKITTWGTNEYRPTAETYGSAKSLRRQWNEDLRSTGATLEDCQNREAWKEIIARPPLPVRNPSQHQPAPIRAQAKAAGRIRSVRAIPRGNRGE